MGTIKFKLTNEFFIVILSALALSIVDILLYITLLKDEKILLMIAGIMMIIVLRYTTATRVAYVVLKDHYFKVREYGPLSPTFKSIAYSRLKSIILVGQTLTIYYESEKSVDVELGDMPPASAILLTEYLQELGHWIKRPGDIKMD